jgi:flagellin
MNMAQSIATNLDSQRAVIQLRKTNLELSDSFERLASGVRINRPGDDPAGLSIVESLRADAIIANAAIRNANDGLSLASIADGGLNEITNLLQRMAELAQQSGNEVYTNDQRSALSSEFLALGSEIERIASTTVFNDRSLLSSSSDITLQVGLDSKETSRIIIKAVSGTLQNLGLSPTNSSQLTYSIIADTAANSSQASLLALDAVKSAVSAASATRGILGAAESRLTAAITNLSQLRENFIEAESRIRDIDVAEEVARLARLQVKQQSAVAVLAQANQQPNVALRLLQ